ncbi:MAG: HAD family phosphatase [Verrucomicrobia bacterium]|nr:HAD family phosphatase [Verrucomicrobiota bacterium]
MVKPKAVVFDLGKVLLHFDFAIAASNLAARCNRSARDLQELLDQSPLLHRYETGLITTERFFAECQRLSGFRGDLTEFGAIFADIFTPIDPIIHLHSDLRSRGVPTYIFSNTNPLAVGHIRRRFEFFEHFDGYIFSFEHGAMKPEPRLCEAVEHLSGCRGDGLLYIDDRSENVAAGRLRGWQTILHMRPPETIEAVRKTGLLA